MRGLCAVALLVGASLPTTRAFIEVSGIQEADNGNKLLDFARKWAAPVGQEGRPLTILTFADFSYAHVLINWLAGMHRLGIKNIGVVCLDDEIEQFMKSIHRPCFLLSKSSAKQQGDTSDEYQGNASEGARPDLAPLWGERLHMLSTIVGGGIDVVMSDSDAFWQRNALPLLTQDDITASRGSFPKDTARRYGATACMGLIYFAGLPRVASFLRSQVMPRFLRTHDDQVALNHALSQSGLEFSERLFYLESKRVVQGRVPRMNLTINLLDHQHFQRRCDPRTIKDSFVGHCLTAKRGQAKATMLSSLNMWLLGDAWRNAGAANMVKLARKTGSKSYEDFIDFVISEAVIERGVREQAAEDTEGNQSWSAPVVPSKRGKKGKKAWRTWRR